MLPFVRFVQSDAVDFLSVRIQMYDDVLGTVLILVVIIGNAIGGLLIPLCQKYMYENPPWWMKKEE